MKRLHLRGHYDKTTVFAILDAAMLAHIGYVLDGQPLVTRAVMLGASGAPSR